MKILKQILIILLFYILGEMISLGIKAVFPKLFLPGTIIGMVLLLIALFTKVIKMEDIHEVGTFLTNNMAFFFIPAAVAVVDYFDILAPSIIKIIIIVTNIIYIFFCPNVIYTYNIWMR